MSYPYFVNTICDLNLSICDPEQSIYEKLFMFIISARSLYVKYIRMYDCICPKICFSGRGNKNRPSDTESRLYYSITPATRWQSR